MKGYRKIEWLVFIVIVGCVSPAWAQISESPPALKFTVNKFEVVGGNTLSDGATEAVLKQYLGQHSGLEGLQAAADALESKIKRRGNNFLKVILPPQTLEGGVVKLQIVQFKLGDIVIENNKYFSEANILRSLPSLEKNKTPNTRYLTRELNIANAHPSKKVEMLFKESSKANLIDARLKVSDKPAGYFFTVLQNTGAEESGEYRLTGGYQYSDLFNRDHGMTFTYTTAPDDTSAVSQLGLNYRLPFYGDGSSLSFVYSDSNVDSGVVQEFFEVSGSGTVIGARYDKDFLNVGAYKHSVAASYNDKLFESDVEYEGQPLATDVRSNPLTLSYSGSMTKAQHNVFFNLSYLKNFPSGSSSTDFDYGTVSSGAVSEWTSFRYSMSYYYRFTNSWLFRTNLAGQAASETLIAGEQFGLGGIDSVRGYEERAILGDSGWAANMELWSKPLTKYKISTLFFYDLGSTTVENPLADEIDGEDVASVGVGLRWYWKDKFSLRMDVASVLEAAGAVEDGDSKLHLSAFYRF